jgi:hypothetical protein
MARKIDSIQIKSLGTLLIPGDQILIEANGRISANVSSAPALIGGTGVAYDSPTGTISIGQNVATTASVTFKDIFVSNNIIVYGDATTWRANNISISDNMIYLNNQSNNSNPDLGIAFNYYDGVYHHAGFFRDASDGVFKAFDNYVPEPDANIFIDTSHESFRLANLQATNYIGNVTGFVTGQVSSLSNHDTADLAEGTNQYFTTARVNATVQPFLTTANVVETSGNLYFTNARVVSSLIAGNQIIIESNGRISANVTSSGGGGISASSENTFTAKQIFQGNTSAVAVKLFDVVEAISVSNTIIGSTGNVFVNIDLANSSTFYFIQGAQANWDFNFRFSPSTFLNSALANSEVISATIMTTQSNVAYYANSIQIDGTIITPKWQDAIAPTFGNASSVDVYSFNIIKTGNVTYTVLATQSRFV